MQRAGQIGRKCGADKGAVKAGIFNRGGNLRRGHARTVVDC